MTGADEARRVAMGRLPDIHQCPHFEDHTPTPEGYIQWHAWAAKMGKTHKCRKCRSCGYYAIWEPRTILQQQEQP